MSNQDVYSAPQTPWSYPRSLPQSWRSAINTTEAPQLDQPQQPPPLPPQQQQAGLTDLASQAGGFSGGDQAPPPDQTPQSRLKPPSPPQRYVASQRDRPPSSWGDPDWALQAAEKYPGRDPGPFMPQGADMWGLVHSISDGLGQGGSNYVGGPARQMGMYSQNMSKAFVEGQLAGYRLNYERLRQSMVMTQARQAEELQKYREAFAIYGPHKEQQDGKEIDSPGDPERLRQEIETLAQNYDDDKLKAALNDGGVQAAERVLATRDGHSQDLDKIFKQQRDEEQKLRIEILKRRLNAPNEQDDPLLGTGTGAPDTGTRAAPAAPPEGDPADPLAPAPGGPDQPKTEPPAEGTAEPGDNEPGSRPIPLGVPESAAEPQETGGGPVQVASSDPNFAPQLAQAQAPTDYGSSPAINAAKQKYPKLHEDAINAAADDYLFGNYKGPKGTPGASIVAQRAAEKQAQLNRILADGSLHGQKMIDAIRQVSPKLAGLVQSAVDGSLPPPRSGANMTKGAMPWIYALAKKVDPTLDANTFMTRGATLRSFAAGQDGRNLTSVATFYKHAQQYLADLEELKKYDPNVVQTLLGQMRTIGPWVVQDPKLRALLGRLDSDVEVVSNEFQRAITGGKPTVSGAGREIGEINYKTKDHDAVVAAVKAKVDQARARMDQLRIRFESGTGRGRGDLIKMFDIYAKEGRGVTTDDLGATSIPTAETAQTVRELLTGPPPQPAAPAPAPPPAPPAQAPAPADKTGSGAASPQDRSQQDSAAREWAKSHPDDPRAKRILEILGR